MKLKQLLIGIVVLSVFIVGCNSATIQPKNSIDQEAIYQETMTKVQNDVSEILYKDSEYVKNNMGLPYCTTYYVDLDKVKNIDISQKNYGINNLRLVYPKYTSDNKLEGSAIYIYLDNDKVSDVQTYELSDYNKEIENPNNKFDIILNKYNENVNVSLEEVEKMDLKSYIGKPEEDLNKELKDVKPNFDAFEFETDRNVKIYILEDVSKSDGELLIVYEQNSIIKDILTTSNNIGESVKNYLYKK